MQSSLGSWTVVRVCFDVGSQRRLAFNFASSFAFHVSTPATSATFLNNFDSLVSTAFVGSLLEIPFKFISPYFFFATMASAGSGPTSPPPLHHSQRNRVSSSTAQFSTEPFKAVLRSRKKTPEALERERLVLPHLPRDEVAQGPVRKFLCTQVYKFLLLVIHTLFSIYLRLRWAYNAVFSRAISVLYYHHRTPQLIQKDVRELKERGKFPKHLSVVLELEHDGLDKLIDEVSEISCWCASAGIPRLSVYERTGARPCLPL
jgi:hypothetical protein